MTLLIAGNDTRAKLTRRGFRLELYPGSATRPANWLDDTFYVTRLNEGYFDATINPNGSAQTEPAAHGDGFGEYIRKYVVDSLVGLSLIPNGQGGANAGSFYLDVSQLPDDGAVYHVIGYRHYSDATPTEQWSRSFASYGQLQPYHTTLDVREEMAHRNEWVEDWRQGMRYWTTDIHAPDDYQVEVHQNDPVVGTFGRQTWEPQSIRSRVVWRPDSPWTVKTKLRHSLFRHWAALVVMCGEAEYISLASSTKYQYWKYANGSQINADIPSGPSPALVDEWHTLEMRGDGAGNVTFYVDGVAYNTITVTFHGALSVWLGHVENGPFAEHTTPNTAYADWGPLTVTGNFDVWGFSDSHHNKDFATDSDFGVGMGEELADFYAKAGGVTLRPTTPNGTLTGPLGGGGGAWPAGSFQAKTPMIFKGPGQSYASLKLAGNTHGHGSLLARVRRADGTLVPDSEIAGNAAGFSPSGSADTTVSLTGVTTDGIYIELTGTNTSAGTSLPPVWQKVEVQFSYDAQIAAKTFDFASERTLIEGTTLAPATETDTALTVRPAHVRSLIAVDELSTAVDLAALKHVTLDPAAETDAAQSVAVAKHLALTPADEFDTTEDLAWIHRVLLDPATEIDFALGLSVPGQDHRAIGRTTNTLASRATRTNSRAAGGVTKDG